MTESINGVSQSYTENLHERMSPITQVIQFVLFINSVMKQAERIALNANPPHSQRAVETLVYSSS